MKALVLTSSALLVVCATLSVANAQRRVTEIRSASFTDLRPKIAKRPDRRAVVNTKHCPLGRADATMVFETLTARAAAEPPRRLTIAGGPGFSPRLLLRFEQDRGRPFIAMVPRNEPARSGQVKISFNGSFVVVPAGDLAKVYAILARSTCGKEILG